jgi:hypothetical protein
MVADYLTKWDFNGGFRKGELVILGGRRSGMSFFAKERLDALMKMPLIQPGDFDDGRTLKMTVLKERVPVNAKYLWKLNSMMFSEWAIAGPVVYKDGEPLFTRHKIHLEMLKFYRDIDDVIYIESIVRSHVEDYKQHPLLTLKKLEQLLSQYVSKRKRAK